MSAVPGMTSASHCICTTKANGIPTKATTAVTTLHSATVSVSPAGVSPGAGGGRGPHGAGGSGSSSRAVGAVSVVPLSNSDPVVTE